MIKAATFCFGRPKTRSSSSIFPLSMESNALEKLTNKIVASRFFARTTSRIRHSQNLWCRGSISPKNNFGSSKFFWQCWVNAIAYKSSVVLGHYARKGYTAVVLRYTGVIHLRVREIKPFVHQRLPKRTNRIHPVRSRRLDTRLKIDNLG